VALIVLEFIESWSKSDPDLERVDRQGMRSVVLSRQESMEGRQAITIREHRPTGAPWPGRRSQAPAVTNGDNRRAALSHE